MAQNRVQYQKGLSMPEFFDRFGSVQQCEGSCPRKWCKSFARGKPRRVRPVGPNP